MLKTSSVDITHHNQLQCDWHRIFHHTHVCISIPIFHGPLRSFRCVEIRRRGLLWYKSYFPFHQQEHAASDYYQELLYRRHMYRRGFICTRWRAWHVWCQALEIGTCLILKAEESSIFYQNSNLLQMLHLWIQQHTVTQSLVIAVRRLKSSYCHSTNITKKTGKVSRWCCNISIMQMKRSIITIGSHCQHSHARREIFRTFHLSMNIVRTS